MPRPHPRPLPVGREGHALNRSPSPRGASGLPEIVDGHDMRMAEQGHRPGLAMKPLGEGRIRADLRREDFQRHQPVESFCRAL